METLAEGGPSGPSPIARLASPPLIPGGSLGGMLLVWLETSRTKSFHSDAANIKIKVRELATKNIFLKLKVLALQLIL